MNQESGIRNHGRRPGLRRDGGLALRYFIVTLFSLFIFIFFSVPLIVQAQICYSRISQAYDSSGGCIQAGDTCRQALPTDYRGGCDGGLTFDENLTDYVCRPCPVPPPDEPTPSSEDDGTVEAEAGAGVPGGRVPAAGGTSGGALELYNPLGTSDIYIVVGRIIRTLVAAIGMIGLLMFIYAGFQWLTAGGNPEKIKKGQQILLWVTIGMAIMFTSYFAVRYILIALTETTGTLPPGTL